MQAPTPRVASFLRPLKGTCFYRLEGWWTYEFCFMKSLRQFHQEKHKSPTGAETTQVTQEYFLGRWSQRGAANGDSDGHGDDGGGSEGNGDGKYGGDDGGGNDNGDGANDNGEQISSPGRRAPPHMCRGQLSRAGNPLTLICFSHFGRAESSYILAKNI